ncbi:hypothetical protein Pfo_028434 [Paulownia fortunei]|nr:hypothetical protein Pfo_028434 [Paulownia fortunei]
MSFLSHIESVGFQCGIYNPLDTLNSNSADNTPASSVQLSPTVNLTREYTLALQTNSYGEIRRTFDQDSSFDQNVDIGHVDVFEEPQLLEQVLRPSRECVQEALSLIMPNSLTYLVATYFEHSEHTSRLCLHLYHSLAFNIFLQFDCLENPFLSPDLHNFDDMRQCFSQLRQQLDHHLRKSQSRVHLIRHCSTGSAFPLCPAILPSSMTKKEMVHLAQLDAAAKGAYVLHNDLDTIDRLVSRLHSAVENDRLLVHLGLERGMDRYPIQEILKQLRRHRPSFVQQLVDLEEHLFLCFAAINRARSLLLQEIHMHQK